jgi:TPR repeat protein
VAAGQGNTVAQFNLGVVLLADDGVAQDVDEAARWFRSAASQGHRNAAIQLARMGVRFEPP